MLMLDSYAAKNEVGYPLEYINLNPKHTGLNIKLRLYSKAKDAEPSLELYDSFLRVRL